MPLSHAILNPIKLDVGLSALSLYTRYSNAYYALPTPQPLPFALADKTRPEMPKLEALKHVSRDVRPSFSPTAICSEACSTGSR